MYPMRLTVESTRRRVGLPTFPVLFKTLETVAVETPAAFATSRMVRLMAGSLALVQQGSPTAQNLRKRWCTKWSRSIAREKILDNARGVMIFRTLVFLH